MKAINYEKIMKEAKEKEISPYLIVKRKINYRKATGTEGTCAYCMNYVSFNTSGGYWSQCKIIGAGCDGCSTVYSDYTCNSYVPNK